MVSPMNMAYIRVPHPMVGVSCGPSILLKKIKLSIPPIISMVQSILILLSLNFPPNAIPKARTVMSAGSIQAPATTSIEIPNAEIKTEDITSRAVLR